jgi:hypothetical protein
MRQEQHGVCVFLLLQAVKQRAFLKWILIPDAQASIALREEVGRRVHRFKKKRELFLISQLSVSKCKFNVTIKDIYTPRTRGTSALFLGNGILTVFPFGSSKPDELRFS